MIQSAYLAAEDFEAPLAEELARRGVTVSGWHGRLALSPDPSVHAAWALDIWTDPREIAVGSVKGAADALRGLQRNWAAYGAEYHRRMALIGERMPPVKARELRFPEAAPGSHLGAWTLLAPDRLLASPTKSSPFVNGECRFVEDHIGPPSRAYLKLWEALVRFGRWPGVGETCLDLGASPGGVDLGFGNVGRECHCCGQGAFGGAGYGDAGGERAVGERVWVDAGAGGLAIQRRHRLSGPLAGAGATLDRGGCGTVYCLHDQVPGGDRP